MSKVNYIEIRDKKTGKVTTVELGGAGGSSVLEKDVSTTGGNLTFADDITIEEFDTLWNNEFIMLNILTGTTEFTSQTLLKKVRQGTAGATPVMSMVFTQVQPTNETTINYAELTISRDTSDDYISSEFKMYDITGGSGDDTNDTAYVEDEVLYIEEGTTAGGGGSQKITLTATPYTGDDFTLFDTTGPFFFMKEAFLELPSKIVDFNNTDISIDDGSGETVLLQYDAILNKYIVYMDVGGLDNKIAFYYVETTNKYLLVGTEALSLMGVVLSVDKNNTNYKTLNTNDYELLLYLIDRKILSIMIPSEVDDNVLSFSPFSVVLTGTFLNVLYMFGTATFKFVVDVVLKNAQFERIS